MVRPFGAGRDDPERRGIGARDTDSGDGDACAAADVLVDHLPGVHPVDVVGTEDHDVIGVLVVDEVQRLEDRVGRARVPPGPSRCCAGTEVT